MQIERESMPVQPGEKAETIKESAAPRVLLLGQDLSSGGAGTHFRTLAKYLFGGRCDVMTLRADPPDWIAEGYHCTSFRATSELDYPRILHTLRRKLQQEPYDAVFGFGPYPNLVLSWAMRGMKSRPATILCEINKPSLATANNARRPQTRLVNWLVPDAYRRADLLTANSIDGVEESIKLFGVQRQKAFRVPNLISADETRAQGAKKTEAALIQDKPMIVVCCRLVPWKRVDTVIESFQAVQAQMPCRLVIVGDGPDKARLERLAQERGVSADVAFLGWQKDPRPILAQAAVAVTASEYEGFSNSIIEAMFLQVPNVTSFSTSDTRDMCEKGAALGFEVGDVQGLAAALNRLLTMPPLRAEIIRNANAYSAAHELSAAIPVYEDLIRKAIHDRQARSVRVRAAA